MKFPEVGLNNEQNHVPQTVKLIFCLMRLGINRSSSSNTSHYKFVMPVVFGHVCSPILST